MNIVRQRLRWFGRATGARTCSASSDCIVRAVLIVPDPLKAHDMDQAMAAAQEVPIGE